MRKTRKTSWWRWLPVAWGFNCLALLSLFRFDFSLLPQILLAGFVFLVGCMAVVTAYKECMGE